MPLFHHHKVSVLVPRTIHSWTELLEWQQEHKQQHHNQHIAVQRNNYECQLFDPTKQSKSSLFLLSSSSSSLALLSCVISIQVQHTRGFWQEVRPRLMDSRPAFPARKLLFCLLSGLSDPLIQSQKQFKETYEHLMKKEQASVDSFTTFLTAQLLEQQRGKAKWFKRNLRLKNLPKGWNGEAQRQMQIYLFVFPNPETYLEYAWEQRLLHWEHRLIKAQSLAGFYSTLGGGYFMTRHVATALNLAMLQQQMAVILNDQNMYLRCQINQAYDAIQCGNFGLAKRLIQNVFRVAAANNDPVLLRMCRSASLFRNRVRKAAIREQPNPQKGDSPIDDFYRIRIVMDQSSKEDLVRSFYLL